MEKIEPNQLYAICKPGLHLGTLIFIVKKKWFSDQYHTMIFFQGGNGNATYEEKVLQKAIAEGKLEKLDIPPDNISNELHEAWKYNRKRKKITHFDLS